MKKTIPPVALAAIGLVVVGVLVMLIVNASNSGGAAPTPEQTQSMNEFRDQNAAKTGGTLDENTGQLTQPSGDQRTSEQIARDGGH